MPSYEGAYAKSKGMKQNKSKFLEHHAHKSQSDQFDGRDISKKILKSNTDDDGYAVADYSHEVSKGKNRVNSRPGGAKQHRGYGFGKAGPIATATKNNKFYST